VSNRKLEGIRIRKVEGRGRIPRKSAQRVKQPKGRKSGEKTRTRVSWEKERERERKTPTKLFYSSPISFHLSRTKFSPCVSGFAPEEKDTNTSIFRAGSSGLSFTQDTISLDHQRPRSAIWWIERLVAGERLERYWLGSRTGR
jgi:hypothetical protein